MTNIQINIENLILESAKISDKSAEYFKDKCLHLIDLWQAEKEKNKILIQKLKNMKKIYAPISDKKDHSGTAIKGFVIVELNEEVKQSDWYKAGRYITTEQLDNILSKNIKKNN